MLSIVNKSNDYKSVVDFSQVDFLLAEYLKNVQEIECIWDNHFVPKNQIYWTQMYVPICKARCLAEVTNRVEFLEGEEFNKFHAFLMEQRKIFLQKLSPVRLPIDSN